MAAFGMSEPTHTNLEEMFLDILLYLQANPGEVVSDDDPRQRYLGWRIGSQRWTIELHRVMDDAAWENMPEYRKRLIATYIRTRQGRIRIAQSITRNHMANAYDFKAWWAELDLWEKSKRIDVQKEGHRRVWIRTQVLLDANTPESGQVGRLPTERGRPTFRAILTSGVNLDGFQVGHYEKFWIVGVEFAPHPEILLSDRLRDPIL